MPSLGRRGALFTDLVLEIFKVNRLLLDAGDRLTEPAGLSSARWQVLGVVEHGPVSVAEIARTMGLTRQSVQDTANALAEGGVVEWHDNPRHRRSRLLKLTRRGDKAMRVVRRRHAEWANAIGDAQDERSLVAALAALRDVRATLERSSS